MSYQPFSSQGGAFKMATTAAPTVFVTINGVVGLDGPDGETEEIEVTDLASTRKTYILGLIEEGQIPFDVQYDPADTMQAELALAKTDRLVRNFKFVMSNTDLSEIAFVGLVKKLSYSFQKGEAAKLKCAVRVTGALTITL
jgi:hypothetical protein